MRAAPRVVLTDEQRTVLQRWARGRTTPTRLVRRAEIVLLAVEGKQNIEIADELGVERTIVDRWRKRFVEHGLAGIEKDAPRGGRPASKRQQVAQRILEVTAQQTPPNATHWSTNRLTRQLDVSQSMVSRVWRANGLKPHWSRTFKVSHDPRFVEKLTDGVGLYLDPPEHALVVDNDATHKHPRVQSWLKKHPRLHMHFTPTSSSWPNLVERWFRDPTPQAHSPRHVHPRCQIGGGDPRLHR